MQKALHLTRNRYVLLPLGAIVIVLMSYAAVGLRAVNGRPGGGNTPTAVQDPAQPAAPGLGIGVGGIDPVETDKRIAFWQQRINANPSSDSAYQYLGELLALKGRETGDIAQYALAEQAFRKAIALFPGNSGAHSDLARNLVTLHRWKEAISEGRTVLESDLRRIGAVAVIGDASLEIGDIDTAAAAFSTLQEKLGGPAVVVRLARLAYLHGDTDGAIRLADEAVATAPGLNAGAEEQAFYHYTAGEYRWGRGDLDGAEREYRAALDVFPKYYLALSGLGRVAFGHGDLDQALSYYTQAVAIIPKPEMLAYLGDLYAMKGDATNAEKQYRAVDFIGSLGDVQSRVYNRELALFEASHQRNVADAVSLAQAELVDRKDIYGYDALAWTLFRAGRPADALEPVQAALALGTKDARLLYHAGMIELATGATAAGQAHLREALALNPAFDVLGAADARKALGQ